MSACCRTVTIQKVQDHPKHGNFFNIVGIEDFTLEEMRQIQSAIGQLAFQHGQNLEQEIKILKLEKINKGKK